MTDPINAGIDKNLEAYEKSIGSSAYNFNGVWNGGENGIRYGV